MRTWIRVAQWMIAGGVLLALGGCVTSQQLFDFGRTELARVISSVVGQAFQLYVQGSS